MAEPVIDFREEDRLIDAGGIFKGDELHGVAVLCLNRLAGDQPPDGGDMLAHVDDEDRMRSRNAVLLRHERQERPFGPLGRTRLLATLQ